MSEARFRLVVAGGVVVAAALFYVAFRSANSGMDDDDVTLSGDTSEFVEELRPGRGDEALSQEGVLIDLASGWTGYLVIDGQEVRTEEQGLIERPELNQLAFTPGDGAVLTAWPTGVNCVTAVVWKQAESEASSRNVSWCFDVT